MYAIALVAVLEGFAVLPAGELAPGPASGQFIEPPAGIATPFRGQPVQGISAIEQGPDGSWLALVDNGFGSRANSADFLLRIYALELDFRTAQGGSGGVRVNGFINLADPGRRIPHPLTADQEQVFVDGAGHPVDPSITSQQLLTGADLDPESMLRAPDGSFWIGDEFGPWLLHFDADGTLLEAPFAVDGLSAPEYATTPTLPSSRGFEGLAVSHDWTTLYPMLEGSLPDQPGLLAIFAFDLSSRSFLPGGAQGWAHRYRLQHADHVIGAFRIFEGTRGVVLERDREQGGKARFKKVITVDLEAFDRQGVLAGEVLVDLLEIADPHDLDGDGSITFRFPHGTIESIAPAGEGRWLLVNDNNHPFGRARDPAQPDATEFILLRVGD